MSDSRAIEELAARLDEVLPPGSYDIFDAPDDAPEIQVAVRIARAPRPVLTGDSRRQIENRMRVRADAVFGAPARFHGLRLARWAAACLLIVVIAAALLIALTAWPNTGSTESADPVHVLYVPSAPDTSVIIPSDAILAPPPLTEIGGGSTSLFIVPGG